ncbi:hypothetical protein DWB61_10115 [Ancylomarina euxinus]|uniref:Haem-binding uptake Tiki superfamily ChaN domain-containing protein n=1 Tax=Ancylomarina euxinus TaxID=2283627 RepID=A0A425Y159_9BACT|nr:hypothetical protein [Ancylomarina euxinus]MCZ4693717.1 hypothetical protein [Ancylomarina euxinus]MUP15203.1 hypothetical protein [Ancylomarina euxinus]RRG21625.1 hypothetical protein DWB61_10115 [Ancylomarina euxinus]
MKYVTFITVFIAILALFYCQKQETEVIICSTIHGFHEKNPNYTYENLFSFIDSYNPDIIGIEIRQEDMDSTVTYLKKFYPFEMYECISKYIDKKLVGFDWLGEELEGKSFPDNYRKEMSVIKRLVQELNQDSIMLKKLSAMDGLVKMKNTIVFNASLCELNNGRLDSINAIAFEGLAAIFMNTKYSEITDSFLQRDEHIAQNIISIINDNPGKKLLFLMGGDHKSYSFKKVKQKFGNQILLNNNSE